MAQPWFDEATFGAVFGAVAGGGFGTLVGMWGALAGNLAPRGIGRPIVVGLGYLFLGLGVVCLAGGIFALISGQPFHIWFWPCQVGVIITLLMAVLVPVVKKRYAEAENRQLQAEQFRGQ